MWLFHNRYNFDGKDFIFKVLTLYIVSLNIFYIAFKAYKNRYIQDVPGGMYNVKNFGSVFLMLKYTDMTQNTYIQS
jgi:hypothetical protein